MPRFFLSGGSSIAGGTAFILGEDAAHAKVLRLRIGDTMIVCDGGKDHHCTVTKITPNEVEAEIFEVVPCQGEPSVHTVILAGLPKGSDKTDYILQKCTEAGASEIYFFASSRCVARIQGDADKKIARWQRIAEEAAKLLATFDPADDVIVCTDLFGGSVNNEFTKIVQTRPNTYLVANMNLPLLIQLLFSDQEAPADQVIREILAADDTRVKFVNDLLTDADDEEEF